MQIHIAWSQLPSKGSPNLLLLPPTVSKVLRQEIHRTNPCFRACFSVSFLITPLEFLMIRGLWQFRISKGGGSMFVLLRSELVGRQISPLNHEPNHWVASDILNNHILILDYSTLGRIIAHHHTPSRFLLPLVHWRASVREGKKVVELHCFPQCCYACLWVPSFSDRSPTSTSWQLHLYLFIHLSPKTRIFNINFKLF